MDDLELLALADIVNSFRTLSDDGRKRVLDYLNDRWGLPIEYAVLDDTEPLTFPTINPVDLDAIKDSIEDATRPLREAFAKWRKTIEGDGR